VATAAPAVLQTAALAGLGLGGGTPVVVATLLALSGLSFAALTTVLGSRMLDVAPGDVDLAAAGLSTAVNSGSRAGLC
jgi:MFS transporter, DHA1 family, inner membrane transport protein